MKKRLLPLLTVLSMLISLTACNSNSESKRKSASPVLSSKLESIKNSSTADNIEILKLSDLVVLTDYQGVSPWMFLMDVAKRKDTEIPTFSNYYDGKNFHFKTTEVYYKIGDVVKVKLEDYQKDKIINLDTSNPLSLGEKISSDGKTTTKYFLDTDELITLTDDICDTYIYETKYVTDEAKSFFSDEIIEKCSLGKSLGYGSQTRDVFRKFLEGNIISEFVSKGTILNPTSGSIQEMTLEKVFLGKYRDWENLENSTAKLDDGSRVIPFSMCFIYETVVRDEYAEKDYTAFVPFWVGMPQANKETSLRYSYGDFKKYEVSGYYGDNLFKKTEDGITSVTFYPADGTKSIAYADIESLITNEITSCETDFEIIDVT